MNIRRFLILSVIALCTFGAYACLYTPVNRYYIRYVSQDNGKFNDRCLEGFAHEWSRLLGAKFKAHDVSELSYDFIELSPKCDNAIVKRAYELRDMEVIRYLQVLNNFCRNGYLEFNSWSYPTAEDIANQKQCLAEVERVAQAYDGKRLRAQYHLLRMKVAFQQKNYQRVKELYASCLPTYPTVFKDMMKDLYAGALYRTDAKREAAIIYSEIGDERSASWMVAQWGDKDGIELFYQLDPNSKVLPMLIKEFCDNLQETVDYIYDNPKSSESEMKESLYYVGAKVIADRNVNAFVQFAMARANDSKVADQLMWSSAAALAKYYMGDYKGAKSILAASTSQSSTEDSRVNRRVLQCFVDVATAPDLAVLKTQSYAAVKYLISRTEWESDAYDMLRQNYFGRMLHRMTYVDLIPRFNKAGFLNGSLSLYAVSIAYPQSEPKQPKPDLRMIFSSDYCRMLDTIPVKDVIAWREFVSAKSPAGNGWQSLAVETCGGEQELLADIIGTRLIRRGEFDEAAKWLAQVSPAMFNQSNLAPYMAVRRFNRIQWLPGRPSVEEGIVYDPQPVTYNITRNSKLEYCRYMQDLSSKYATAKGEAKVQAARLLAAGYAQASPKGECWWLARYGVSTEENPLYPGDMDMLAKSRELLQFCYTVGSASARLDALFALTFYSPDNMFAVTETYDDGRAFTYDNSHALWSNDFSNLDKSTQQYANYVQLVKATKPGTVLPSYIKSCDILKRFRKYAK